MALNILFSILAACISAAAAYFWGKSSPSVQPSREGDSYYAMDGMSIERANGGLGGKHDTFLYYLQEEVNKPGGPMRHAVERTRRMQRLAGRIEVRSTFADAIACIIATVVAVSPFLIWRDVLIAANWDKGRNTADIYAHVRPGMFFVLSGMAAIAIFLFIVNRVEARQAVAIFKKWIYRGTEGSQLAFYERVHPLQKIRIRGANKPVKASR